VGLYLTSFILFIDWLKYSWMAKINPRKGKGENRWQRQNLREPNLI
jgi:hypothetical protein